MQRNFTSRILLAAAALALIAGSTATSAHAQTPHTVAIENRSGYGIYHVYLSSNTDPWWGRDQLGDSVLSSGYRSMLVDDFENGDYDLKLVDTDGDVCVVHNVDVSGNTTWNISTTWLLNCEFH